MEVFALDALDALMQLQSLLACIMQCKGSNGNGMHRGKNGRGVALHCMHNAGSQHDACGVRTVRRRALDDVDNVESRDYWYCTHCTDRKHCTTGDESGAKPSKDGTRFINHSNTYGNTLQHAPDDM